jgi:ATP-binding cassette subfamily B protein
MRLFELGGHFAESYQDIRRRLRGQWLGLARKESLAELGAGLASLLVLAAAMAWMTLRAIRGAVSLGDLALFYQAFNQALGVARTTLENLGKFYENSLFLGNLFEFLDLKPQIASPDAPRALALPLREGIRLEHVRFRYPGSGRLTLDDFNLELRPGETAALVGPNGTGKSTLVKLLCRFYDPEGGSITMDGVPLPQLSLSELRRAMTVFFQQPVQYNDTVEANLRLGDLRLGDDEAAEAMRRAAALCGLDEIVARLPEGYRTQLGRGFLDGCGLSVGEWQRLALTRAILRPAPVLILDEPTSAMDPWAELNWAGRLREIAGGRITLLITHRFTTAMFADVIHVLAEGRIVESGSHAELLAAGSVYARGWAAQSRASRQGGG